MKRFAATYSNMQRWSKFGLLTLPSLLRRQRRWLNLHEYQSKGLMASFGVNVQRFKVVSSREDAVDKMKDFQCAEYVVKAQIMAGGRGKGVFSNGLKGGVQLTKSVDEVIRMVGMMVGERLVTKQTAVGGNGVLVTKVMVAEALDITREAYLAMVMDRVSGGVMVVCSERGGVDIEEVAIRESHALLREAVDITQGLTGEQCARVARHMGFEDREQVASVVAQLRGLYRLFLQHDCTQIEINPLGVTPAGAVVCFDAKITFDDNAEFRQPAIFALRESEEAELHPLEVAAARAGLSYVGLEGDIGCMVNGAGLAMATMDIVHLHGGAPANFLDLGGGVTVPQVQAAFHILASDPNVKCILINIFGGIVNCATVAEGLVLACKAANLTLPLVVRLEGTNVEEARAILGRSGLRMHTSSDLEEAALMAVAALPSP